MIGEIETVIMQFKSVPFDGIAEWYFTNGHDWQGRIISLLVFREGIVTGFNFPVFIVEDNLSALFDFNNDRS